MTSAVLSRVPTEMANKLFILVLALIPFALCNHDLASTYQFNATLVQNKYWLYWNFNKTTEVISFAVRVQTTGWIGFGISPNGQMPNSDVVIGWIDDSSKSYFHDRFAFGRYTPPIDPIQNWFLSNAEQDSGYTVLEFYRNFTSCDKNDRDILFQTQRVVYSWNDNDPTVTQNGDGTESYNLQRHTSQGSTSLNLLGGLPGPPNIPNNTQAFNIAVNNVSVPNVETTYWCDAMRLDDAVRQSEKYVIKFSPIITPGNEEYVHHILVYLCNGLQQSDLNNGGNCFSSNGVSNRVQNCLSETLIAAWAVGGADFIYPDNVAFPVGGPNATQFAVVEMHYNNPRRVSGIKDSSGLSFTYINTRREHDAGILYLGHTVTNLMIIPPKAANFTVTGLCTDSCTKLLPPGGIHIFGNLLHTHLAGTGLTLIHLNETQCSGTSRYRELPPIDENLSYDFNFQQTTHLSKEVTVLPGDIVMLKCYYNTTARTNITLGGLSSYDEMCLSFPVYYPRITAETITCTSFPTFDKLTQFATYVPENKRAALNSLTTSSSSNDIHAAFDPLDWTPDLIAAFERFIYTNGIQYAYCEGGTNQGFLNITPLICCPYRAYNPCSPSDQTSCCRQTCPLRDNSINSSATGNVGFNLVLMTVIVILAFVLML